MHRAAEARKAIAAALAPLLVFLITWAQTGVFDAQEFALLAAAVIAAVFTYVVPNKPNPENEVPPR